VIFFAWASMQAAAPEHDRIADARELVPFEGSVPTFIMAFAGATTDASDPDIPAITGYNLKGTVWMKWTPSRWTDATLSSEALNATDSGLVVLEDNGNGALTLTSVGYLDAKNCVEVNGGIACHFVGYNQFRGRPGTTYYFALYAPLMSFKELPDRISVAMYTAEVPNLVNDAFSQRTPLEGARVTFDFDTNGATREAGEPIPFNSGSLWWEWTAPGDGLVAIRTSGTTSPTDVVTFHGNRPEALQVLDSGPALVGRPVSAGEKLILSIMGRPTNGPNLPVKGQAQLVFSSSSVLPANDAFTAAMPLNGVDAVGVTGDLALASIEPGEPSTTPSGCSLWYTVTSSVDGFFELAVSGMGFSPATSVYRGDTLAALEPVPAIETWLVPPAYRIRPGETLRIQVQPGAGWPGSFSIKARLEAGRVNDAFADRLPVTGTHFVLHAWLAGGGFEPAEPTHPSAGGQSAWWTWQSPVTGMARVTGGSLDPSLPSFEVYTGVSLDRLVPVPVRFGPVSDGAHAVFNVVAGEVYQIRSVVPGGIEGMHWLPVDTVPSVPVVNDRPETATVLHGWEVGHASNASATRDPHEPAANATSNRILWWRWRAPVTGPVNIGFKLGSVRTPKPAIYTGTVPSSLTPVNLVNRLDGSGVFFPARSGGLYWFAIETSGDDVGEVFPYLDQRMNGIYAARTVPGELLPNGSFELPGLDPTMYWGLDIASLGAWVREPGGVDGGNYVDFSQTGGFWTEFPSEPGATYRIDFATKGYAAESRVLVRFGDTVAGLADSEPGYNPNPPYWANYPPYWQWETFYAVATSTTTRLRFEQVYGANLLDGVSVTRFQSAPFVTTPLADRVAIDGLAAAFTVEASGTAPLHYQWFFNGAPIVDAPDLPTLTLTRVTAASAGTYRVSISNAEGSISGGEARLQVEPSSAPVIVAQPAGDSVVEGQYYALSVSAIGELPISYQWDHNGVPITDATNRALVLPAVTAGDLGRYSVLVTGPHGANRSLPAELTSIPVAPGGGQVVFQNLLTGGVGTPNAPVFDLDGTTPLSGAAFVAQLYAGPSTSLLRPIGSPVPFQSGLQAGFFRGGVVAIPGVAPGTSGSFQVRVWEAATGPSYEVARASGGKVGRSGILTLTPSTPPSLPIGLAGLGSFSLGAGVPAFFVGRLDRNGDDGSGRAQWRISGRPSLRYLIEVQRNGGVWTPLTVVSSPTGAANFTDPESDGTMVLYRARLLE
jgi:hypothetical protein